MRVARSFEPPHGHVPARPRELVAAPRPVAPYRSSAAVRRLTHALAVLAFTTLHDFQEFVKKASLQKSFQPAYLWRVRRRIPHRARIDRHRFADCDIRSRLDFPDNDDEQLQQPQPEAQATRALSPARRSSAPRVAFSLPSALVCLARLVRSRGRRSAFALAYRASLLASLASAFRPCDSHLSFAELPRHQNRRATCRARSVRSASLLFRVMRPFPQPLQRNGMRI